MLIDITNLDRKLLLRALLAYAEPVGNGFFEYNELKAKGKIVDEITDAECEEILHDFETMQEGHLQILDYFRGKPLKLYFNKKDTGQIIASTSLYDFPNGKYRFFEAVLDTFLPEEIKITRKCYGSINMISKSPEHIKRSEEKVIELENIIDNCEVKEDQFGEYWTLNSTFKYENGIYSLLNI